VEDLPVLADLRYRSEIRVLTGLHRAWICWEPGSELMQGVLASRLLPLPTVELFVERGGRYYRLGEHLPALDVPDLSRLEAVSLDRILLPQPIAAHRPIGDLPDPLPIRLVRSEPGFHRPTSALRCRLGALYEWANHATSAELAPLVAAWTEAPGGRDEGALVLVLCPEGVLPPLLGGIRFWGTDLLIPLGFRALPELPESALRRAASAGASDLVVLDRDGFELIPRSVFKPLDRAGINLAREGSKTAAWEGSKTAACENSKTAPPAGGDRP
jgi:hypothetical protein